MAYIELEELKDVLPGALDCCGLDAEDIEWVLQEVEQKFHIGKKPDGKKRKKLKKTEIDMILKRLADVEKRAYNECVGTGAIENLNGKIRDLSHRIDQVKTIADGAKSQAEIAKQRTEVDYSKYSGKSDGSVKYSDYVIKEADVIQNVYNRMAKRGATRQELDTFRGLIHKYNALDTIIENNPEDKDCKTCKYYCDTEAITEPCCTCDAYQCWEAKKNG